MNSKLIGTIVAGIVGLAVFAMNIGVNDAGYRTVIQYPNGTMSVKMEPGVYFPLFGKTTEYPDYLTYDFSPADDSCDFEQNDGIKVRYQDGGEGIVCGMANAQLPTDEVSMIALHKRYRTPEGVRVKLLNQSFPKVLNLTAGLLTSEEAYATKRAEYIRMSKDQSINGLYKTKLVQQSVEVVGADGEVSKQVRDLPEIVMEGNNPVYQGSDFSQYSITLEQFDLKAWDFEPRTLQQIADKRKAEMAIVTAKANANKAHYEKQQVIADGEKKVAQAEYEAKVRAEKQIQEAERDKQLALIEASKVKDRATEMKLAAIETTAQKAEELKAAQIEADIIKELADANAYKIDKEQQAGELFKRIDAEVQQNADMADAIARMNVPATMIVGGGNATDGSTEMQQLLQLQVLDKLGKPAGSKSSPK